MNSPFHFADTVDFNPTLPLLRWLMYQPHCKYTNKYSENQFW